MGGALMQNQMLLGKRMFSDAQVQATEQPEEDFKGLSLNQRVGADEHFDEQKHAYVLTFPWNFEEVIQEFDTTS